MHARLWNLCQKSIWSAPPGGIDLVTLGVASVARFSTFRSCMFQVFTIGKSPECNPLGTHLRNKCLYWFMRIHHRIRCIRYYCWERYRHCIVLQSDEEGASIQKHGHSLRKYGMLLLYLLICLQSSTPVLQALLFTFNCLPTDKYAALYHWESEQDAKYHYIVNITQYYKLL